MYKLRSNNGTDIVFLFAIFFLLVFGLVILHSTATSLFPFYYSYILLGILAFYLITKLDFEIISLFSRHFYIASILLLLLPIIFGQVTRGTIRWIPLGPITIQPSEIIRPFIYIFFANLLANNEIIFKRGVWAIMLFLPIFLLIVLQPSLGVAIITGLGFLGIILSSSFPKKYIISMVAVSVFILPLLFSFLAPYQKQRIMTFVNPSSDPLGAGYNSLQSQISVGSGQIFGRGLGKGVQTQLSFLPERHTDFIFASVSEEMGFVGSFLLTSGIFLILWKLTEFIALPESKSARNYLAGIFVATFFQTIIHIGMNVGLLPITGVPFPLVSAGGSSLIATMIGLGIALKAKRA